MGERTVKIKVSDLSGQDVEPDDQMVRVVVLEHPALDGRAVQFEATPDEIAPAIDAALSVAVFEIHPPSGDPRRLVVDVGDFDALAKDRDMGTLLKQARPVKAGTRKEKPSTDYTTLEHAGTPHRGRVTAEEAALVREHLADINQRLAAEDLRQIDPADPEHATRYGFPAASA